MTKAERAYRNRKLLDLAHSLPCANCGMGQASEPAHSNSQRHGKAISRKADDMFFAALCHTCHGWLDQGSGKDPTGVWSDDRADKQAMWRAALSTSRVNASSVAGALAGSSA
jgi:hypothetical protein